MTATDLEALLAALGIHVEGIERSGGMYIVTIRPLRVNAQTFAKQMAKAQADAGITPTGVTWSAQPDNTTEELWIKDRHS